MGVASLFGDSILVGKLKDVISWGRKYSLWPTPFATACCGIEYMSVMAARNDLGRFGAERQSFSPRQADLLIVIGTICLKARPVLRKVWEQMPDPKWCISMGACASSGGMFDVYSVSQGVDDFIPVDVFVPGCPPRPEMLLHALILLQEKIQGTPGIGHEERTWIRRQVQGEVDRQWQEKMAEQQARMAEQGLTAVEIPGLES
ncbi:MAG: NADH-quinone oxidoreductase subunit B [bacterium]